MIDEYTYKLPERLSIQIDDIIQMQRWLNVQNVNAQLRLCK